MQSKVAVVVVAYEPETARLRTLLEAFSRQAARILVVDNTPPVSAAAGSARAAAAGIGGVLIRNLGENVGVGRALNIGITAAIEGGCEFVLLSDQDSLPSDNMVDALVDVHERLEAQGNRVGAVSALYADEVTGRTFGFQVQEPGRWFYSIAGAERGFPWLEVVSGITSGTLSRASVFPEVGMMREDYFIDFVDTEWFHRARAHGYGIYGTSRAILRQRLGEEFFRAWLGRWFDVTSYPPSRLYFRHRNFMAMAKESHVPLAWKVRASLYLLGNLYGYVLFSRARLESLKYIARGIRDGLVGRMGRTHTP
jgi:rhamnosyltransferase